MFGHFYSQLSLLSSFSLSLGDGSIYTEILSQRTVKPQTTNQPTVGQGHAALAVGAGGGCLDIFTLIYPFSPLSHSGGGRVVRWYWVNFQCRGVLQFGYSRARAYCARSRCGWGLFGLFYSHLSFLSSFSLSLGDGSI